MIYRITGSPGSFVALDVIDRGDGLIWFHDTARVRVAHKAEITLKPLTLATWNRLARKHFNPQAPRFSDRDTLFRALREAADKAM
jgi:hypothetical protein